MRPKPSAKDPVIQPSTGVDPFERLRNLIGSRIVISAALALITLVVFLPVVRNEFVNYDDSDYVTANSHVLDGLTWAGIKWAFTTGHASNWHPLTWISHMIDCQLFGQRAWGHHLVSAVLHCANTVLIFLLLDSMTGGRWKSAFVAALFALHPLHVESVAWASERKDVLCALFFLLTIWVWKEYAGQVSSQWSVASSEGGAAQRGPRTSVGGGIGPRYSSRGTVVFLYVLSLVLFAFALMSKPMAVTLPFVLLLLDYWPLERLFVRRKNAGLMPQWAFVVLEKVPFLVLSLISCRITYLVQQHGGAVSTSVTIGARIENATVAYAMYLRNMFWPHDLAVLYPHPGYWPLGAIKVFGVTLSVRPPVAWAGAVLVAITVLVLVLQLRRRYLATGWGWYLGMLIPVIGLIQVGVQSMADRYTYLPLIGIFMMIAWGTEELVDLINRSLSATGALRQLLSNRNQKIAFGVAAGVCLTACAAATITQIEYWQNSEMLFRHTASVTKKNYLAYNNLGYYLSGRGKVEEAMENYRKALEINPQYEDAYNNMGYALAGLKRYPEAIAHYEAALRIKPNHTEVHNNLGNALADTGRIDEAIKHYRIVLAQAPEHADAHNNLGIALAMKGELTEAIEHFQKAIRYKKNYASAHSNLGNAYAVQRNFPEAIAEYRESLRLNPGDAQAHNNLGNALAEQGQLADAAGEYTLAIKMNSDNPEAHFNLALALAREGKRDEATAHLKEALRLKPTYEEARKQLAVIEGKGQ